MQKGCVRQYLTWLSKEGNSREQKENEMRKERNETNFRNTVSNDGTFSPHIGKTTTERLTKYCKLRNINRTKFVESCINTSLDTLEEEYLHGLSKEELISIIKNGH